MLCPWADLAPGGDAKGWELGWAVHLLLPEDFLGCSVVQSLVLISYRRSPYSLQTSALSPQVCQERPAAHCPGDAHQWVVPPCRSCPQLLTSIKQTSSDSTGWDLLPSAEAEALPLRTSLQRLQAHPAFPVAVSPPPTPPHRATLLPPLSCLPDGKTLLAAGKRPAPMPAPGAVGASC